MSILWGKGKCWTRKMLAIAPHFFMSSQQKTCFVIFCCLSIPIGSYISQDFFFFSVSDWKQTGWSKNRSVLIHLIPTMHLILGLAGSRGLIDIITTHHFCCISLVFFLLLGSLAGSLHWWCQEIIRSSWLLSCPLSSPNRKSLSI